MCFSLTNIVSMFLSSLFEHIYENIYLVFASIENVDVTVLVSWIVPVLTEVLALNHKSTHIFIVA